MRISTRKIIASSLAEASSLAPRGGPHVLLLRSSDDMVCRNIMCSKLGNVCLCRLALCLSRCPNLKSIDLSGNKLDSIPDAIGLCTNLYSIDISNNNLRTLPKVLSQNRYLHEIDLRKNPLSLSIEDILSTRSVKTILADRDQVTDDLPLVAKQNQYLNIDLSKESKLQYMS